MCKHIILICLHTSGFSFFTVTLSMWNPLDLILVLLHNLKTRLKPTNSHRCLDCHMKHLVQAKNPKLKVRIVHILNSAFICLHTVYLFVCTVSVHDIYNLYICRMYLEHIYLAGIISSHVFERVLGNLALISFSV